MKSRPRFVARSRSFLELLATLTLATILFSVANDPRSVSATHNPRLLISEVYPAAVTSDSTASSIESHEWVEIHNAEAHAVDLGGWIIEDSQAIARLPDVAIPANSSVIVVGRSTNLKIPAGKMAIVLESTRIGTGLRNAGDRIALVNPYGVRYDAVSWGDVRTPRHMDPPEPRQSIIRTRRGFQRISDQPSPWTTAEALSARPERHAHPRPDTLVRIISARLDATDELPESVTIQNVSQERLLTINWRLSVGTSSVRLRSVKIDPGETYTITEPDSEIAGGLSRKGGHFVLRDSDGKWLSSASWGDDTTFHRLPAPAEGEEIQFSPFARMHPRVPWHERFGKRAQLIVGDQQRTRSLRLQDVSHGLDRFRSDPVKPQESGNQTVWISEVHPAAGQGRNDAAYEWFEITNSGDEPADLSGWTVADNRSADPLGELVIPPQSSVVIGVSTDAGPEILPVISDGRIGNGLANAGDQLTLLNAEGEVVSAMSWGDDRTYTTARAPKPEESLHRSSPVAEPTIAAPSPGEAPTPVQPTETQAAQSQAAQSQAVGERDEGVEGEPSTGQMREEAADVTRLVVKPAPSRPALRITEIMPAPLPGEAEWVEIFNPSQQAVDLTGWTIGDLTRQTPLSGPIGPRSYLVIANEPMESSTRVLVVERIGNSLNNDGDTISLHDPEGEPRFSISYGNGDVPAPAQGLSLALDPARWVVTLRASPGSEEVTPLLEDAFRSPTVRPQDPENDRLPLVAEPPDEGLNAWMIVSFALIGVILTLIVRRWQPEPEPAEASLENTPYSGPPPQSPEEHEPKRNGHNQRE